MTAIASVNVGLPKDVQKAEKGFTGGNPRGATPLSERWSAREIEWKGKTIRTAVWKESIPSRHKVGRLNIDGDGQGDLRGHGGEQRTILVYQIDSYRYWDRSVLPEDIEGDIE